jgi:hypothetical protein
MRHSRIDSQSTELIIESRKVNDIQLDLTGRQHEDRVLVKQLLFQDKKGFPVMRSEYFLNFQRTRKGLSPSEWAA